MGNGWLGSSSSCPPGWIVEGSFALRKRPHFPEGAQLCPEYIYFVQNEAKPVILTLDMVIY